MANRPLRGLLPGLFTLTLLSTAGCARRGGSFVAPSALGLQVNEAALAADLKLTARARPSRSAGWQAVQDVCASRLTSLGYAVERFAYGTGLNVIGRKPGEGRSGEAIVLSAHYDSIEGCAGADDNASGVSALLEAARLLAAPAFARELVVACWDEEETGLLGARAYATRAKTRGERVAVAYVLETVGYKSDAAGSQRLPDGLEQLFPEQVSAIASGGMRGDFAAVIASASARGASALLRSFGESYGLPVVALDVPQSLLASPAIADLRRSDHAAFWDAGFPALMVTDTADFRNRRYHCTSGNDSAETLDTAFLARVTSAVVASVAETLGAP